MFHYVALARLLCFTMLPAVRARLLQCFTVLRAVFHRHDDDMIIMIFFSYFCDICPL